MDPANANEPRLLCGGTAAYARMCERIEQARVAVDLETYVYADDEVGARFRDVLVRAARRGVQVRVLVDAFGSEALSDDFFAPLLAAGGEFRRFNPRPLLRLSFRNHRKLLRCDDVAFVGGLNVASEYDGDGIERGWRDFALEVDGAAASQLAAGFERMWQLAPFGRAQVREFWRRVPPAIPRDGPSTADPRVRVLLSGPGCRTAELRRQLALDIRQARHCCAWAAYLLISRRLLRAMAAAARVGRMELLMGRRSDVAVSRWASERQFGSLLRRRVRLFLYEPQIVHAKVVVADDVVYVGSANLDIRSLRINYELSLRIESPALAARLRGEFAADCRRAEALDLAVWKRGRRWWHALRSYLAWLLLARVDPFVADRNFRSLL